MPVLIYFFLLWEEYYEEQLQTEYQIHYAFYLLYILFGAVLSIGIYAAREMAVKSCRYIACFWIVLMPVIYSLIFSGIVQFSFAMAPFAKAEYFLILEGIYITVFLSTIVNKRR